MVINSKIVENGYDSYNRPSKIDGWLYDAKFTTLTIGDNITKIGSQVFYDCDSLTSVTIPDSVTKIGYEAFYDCDSLTSVTIPDSVTSVGSSAFRGCALLTSIYCKATTPPAGGYDMFNGTAQNLKIYVPRNSVEAYKSASNWRYYASSIEGYDF